jgi:hypothetical protein
LSSSEPNVESELRDSSVGSGVATVVDPELDCVGFGEWASIIHPVKKLKTLVIVIQKRIPSFRNFIHTFLLSNHDLAIIGQPYQAPLL